MLVLKLKQAVCSFLGSSFYAIFSFRPYLTKHFLNHLWKLKSHFTSSRSQHKSFSFQLFHLKCKQSVWKSKKRLKTDSSLTALRQYTLSKCYFTWIIWMLTEVKKNNWIFFLSFFFSAKQPHKKKPAARTGAIAKVVSDTFQRNIS